MPSVFDERLWGTPVRGPELDFGFRDDSVQAAFERGGHAEAAIDVLAFAGLIPRRSYTWPIRRKASEARLVDAFFADVAAPFYLQDPKVRRRTAVALGTATAAQTVFSLPTSPAVESYRDYTAHDGAGDGDDVVVYLDGTPAAVASVDRDARTVTLASGADAGDVVTADYDCLRLCRLVNRPEWVGVAVDWLQAVLEIREVVR